MLQTPESLHASAVWFGLASCLDLIRYFVAAFCHSEGFAFCASHLNQSILAKFVECSLPASFLTISRRIDKVVVRCLDRCSTYVPNVQDVATAVFRGHEELLCVRTQLGRERP